MENHRDPQVDDFYRYTSGRWLWDEKQQLQNRYTAFNVEALQSVAARSIGSTACTSMSKIAEGGFNKVFRLRMNDNKTAIARIPNPNSGPAFFTTASEVATMEFNPVGTEYIIMEEAVGESLEYAWPDLSAKAKLTIMHEIVSLEAKLSSFPFTSYGNLYFAKDRVSNAVPAMIAADFPASVKDDVSKRFTIGPVCDRAFWRKEHASLEADHGPWLDPSDYARAIAFRELKYLKAVIQPQIKQIQPEPTITQDNHGEHMQLLNRYLEVVPYILNIGEQYTRATLFHTDMHGANLFMANNKITAVLDWQGVWAGPLFLLSRPSPVISYTGPLMLSRPDDFEDLKREEQDRLKRQIESSSLQQLYQYETKQKNPDLSAVFDLEHGRSRRLPIERAGDTWENDLVSFRETLINIEKYWEEINDDIDCPYHFSMDEIRNHLQEAGGWNEAQDFFDELHGLVDRNGWTRRDTFEQAQQAFRDLQDKYLTHLDGPERLNFERYTHSKSP